MKRIMRGYSSEDLSKMYLEEKMTAPQISSKYGLPLYCVEQDLAKLHIGRDPKTAAIVSGVKKAIDKDELYRYYIIENHSTNETAEHFNVHNRTIRRRLREFNIVKDEESQKQAWFNSHRKKYGDVFVKSQYYRENVVDSMIAKVRSTCQSKYGIDWISQNAEVRAKAQNTCVKRYGAKNYTQTREYHCKSSKAYRYNGQSFDSSWELALWIYAKDHGETIIRSPKKFSYIVDGKRHFYFPDFEYKGMIIEIKGDHLINDQGILTDFNSTHISELTKAKTACMKKHNVVIWKKQDIQFALDYIYNKYGHQYLKNFHKAKEIV